MVHQGCSYEFAPARKNHQLVDDAWPWELKKREIGDGQGMMGVTNDPTVWMTYCFLNGPGRRNFAFASVLDWYAKCRTSQVNHLKETCEIPECVG